MKSQSIKLASIVGIVIMLAVLATVGLYGLAQLNKLSEVRNSLRNSQAVISKIRYLFDLMKDAETGQRGFLITNDERYLAPYYNALDNVNRCLDQLRQLTAHDLAQHKDILTLETPIHNKIAELKETIDLRRTKGFDAARDAVLTDRGKNEMDKIRHSFAEVYQREYEQLVLNQQEQDLRARNAFLWFFLLCVVALIFQFVMGILTINFLERERRATAKLREQAELIDLSHDAILVRALDGTIRYWSVGAEAMYGYGKNEAIGQKSEDLFANEMCEEANAVLLKNGYWEAELKHRTSDNKPIIVASRQVLTLTPQGEPAGVLEINTDITLQKEAERKQIALTEMERVNVELEQFTYLVSHDLQEPLRTIAGCLQILEKSHKDKLDGDAKELMHFAVDGALRMRTLINDLLSLSSVHNSQLVLKQTSLEEVMAEVRKNLEASLNESGATLTYENLPRINAEKTLMTQLFQNLVSNSIKFGKHKPPNINITATKENNHWKICVIDDGIGFENQYADKIFQPFKRLHGKDTYAGNGIGLAMCKRIVERHGGKIWAESKLGEGATFCFTIPDFS